MKTEEVGENEAEAQTDRNPWVLAFFYAMMPILFVGADRIVDAIFGLTGGSRSDLAHGLSLAWAIFMIIYFTHHNPMVTKLQQRVAKLEKKLKEVES